MKESNHKNKIQRINKTSELTRIRFSVRLARLAFCSLFNINIIVLQLNTELQSRQNVVARNSYCTHCTLALGHTHGHRFTHTFLPGHVNEKWWTMMVWLKFNWYLHYLRKINKNETKGKKRRNATNSLGFSFSDIRARTDRYHTTTTTTNSNQRRKKTKTKQQENKNNIDNISCAFFRCIKMKWNK